MNSYLCRRDAELRGFDDGIMLDTAGRIAEASAANMFFCTGRELVTPQLTPEILDGITRRVILELAANFGIRTIERPVVPSELSRFEAAFLCSTLMEVRPVDRIDGIALGSATHPLFLRIRDGFRSMTRA